jgi:hypothetical protein
VIRSEHRLEILVVSVIVLLAAFYVRAEYIPPWAERNLAVAEEKWGLPVSGVSPWFSAWTLGDGQAYAAIAADPLALELGDHLRGAGYRYQRAGYSWLTWVVSGGQRVAIPYALAAVGALAVIGTLMLAISLRTRLGPTAWFLVLNPALYIGFAGDTAEPMAILLLGMTLASNSVLAAVALGVTRPDYLIAVLGRWRPFLAGLGVAAILAIYVTVRFGLETMVPGGALGLPFVNYIEKPSIAGWLLAALAVATGVIGLRYRNWTWVVVGLFVLCFSYDVLEEPVNAWRAAGLMPVLWAFGPRVVGTQRVAEPEGSPAAAAV